MSLRLGTLSLRYRLFILAAASIVPLAIFAAFAVMSLVAERRYEAERSALELSRAIASAVRGELRSTLAALDGLALAAQLDGDNIEAFDRLAQRALAERPTWRAVILTDASGRLLNRRGVPGEGRQPRVVDSASLERVLQTAKPAIGNLMLGPGGQYAIALRVPVMRDGQLRFVLSVAIKPDGIVNILSMQKVPADWVVAVLDANNIIVARSRGQQEALGQKPSQSLAELLAHSEGEGFRMTLTRDGIAAYTGISQLREIKWTVAVGIPSAEVDATSYQSLAVYGAGIAASFALSALLALLLARGISVPVAQLGRAATALGRGQAVPAIACGIPEIDEVGKALEEAAGERARIETEKEQLRAAEHEALRRAQDAARAKDEFLAMLGHELRNPLAPIVTTLELMRLRGDKQSEPQLQILKRQVTHMTRLVNDLLDVSRITAGRIELDMAPVEFNSIVERALEAVAPLMAKRTRQIDVVLCPQPVWVCGDAIRLVQVMTNLLANALKFTAPDGAISITVRRKNDDVIVSLLDAGVGIPEELLPRIFEAFTQGQQPLARRTGGLGLGLAIVKNLVQSHGGFVSAHSAGPGTGSRFTVTLPLIRHKVEEEAAGKAARPAGQSGDILIVDDNFDAAETLASALRSYGYQVHCAFDAESALDAFSRRTPDLAILDIGLPTMDGYQLAEAIRRNPAWFPCRLLALSGYGQQADRKRAMTSGFSEHITKPVELEVLELVVASLLEESFRLRDA